MVMGGRWMLVCMLIWVEFCSPQLCEPADSTSSFPVWSPWLETLILVSCKLLGGQLAITTHTRHAPINRIYPVHKYGPSPHFSLLSPIPPHLLLPLPHTPSPPFSHFILHFLDTGWRTASSFGPSSPQLSSSEFTEQYTNSPMQHYNYNCIFLPFSGSVVLSRLYCNSCH